MPIIKLYDHPFAGGRPSIFEHRHIAEWLIQQYGDHPDVSVQVFEGEPSAATEITSDIRALVANRAAEYTVLQSPGAQAVVAAFALWATAAVAIGAAVAVLLTPKSPSVGDQNRTIGSPNNDLAERTNKVRVLKRIEDIYGTVRSLPSLIMPTYTKYINHVQYEYAYYCVGRGYYSIADLRDGETLLSEIDGARAAIYDPFTSPNSGDYPVATVGDSIEDDILTVSRSNEIDGFTLKALNQVQLIDPDTYDFVPAALFPASGDVIRQSTGRPNMASVIAPGDTLTVTMTSATASVNSTGISASTTDDSFNGSGFDNLGLEAGDTITVSGFTDGANNGTFTVASATNTKIVVTSNLVTEADGDEVTITRTVDYSGTYEVDSVEDGYVILTTTTFTGRINDKSCTVAIDGVDEWSSWITLPQTTRTQVWMNLIALNGIFKDGGEGKVQNSAEIEFEIEKLDASLSPTGTVETVTETISGATSDTRAVTIEHVTSFTGPCRVRARRTTPYNYEYAGAVVDEIKWADLYSVSPVESTDFGNVTTIHTVTKATLLALAAKQRQLNCLASRLLPTYNGSEWSGSFDSDGRLLTGTISATSRWIDILAAVSIDPWIGSRSIDDLDMRQLWATYQAVENWYPDFAKFNYTFDSDNTSYEDTVRVIADACFCTAYRQNGKIRFAFQREQTSSNLPTFTHRNKRPDAETITRTFANDGEYDGVEFVYTDPDTERQETIRLPLDGNYTKLKKIEIPGIRSFVTAWVRANRELQRIRSQRMVLEFEATTDARLLLPGTRIDVVDDTRFTRYGGEVVGQSGLELTLSQPVSFTEGESHSIILMRRDGTTQSITCTAGASANKVILSGLPDEPVVTTYSQDGIRTIYSFASDSVRANQSWLVQEIEPRDQDFVRIRAINYTPDYYAYDTGEIPDKNSIIYA